MSLVKSIDHVLVAAPENCEMSARKFYDDILGLTEVEKPEGLKGRGGVWFQIGSQQLHIGVEKDFKAAQKAHPAFVVENLEELMTVMEKHNIEVTIDDCIEGVKRFFCYDPFGNRLEFLQKH